jgi:hypothetical protein
VFISHAGEQKFFARELRADLKDIGIRAFVDKDDLRGADHAPDIMKNSAAAAPVGVAVFSSDFFRKVCL